MKKVKDAKGKVTVDFQRSLKRLRKFNEKRVDCHAKKKPKQAVTGGRENPGVEPVQSGLLTDAFSITGESSPESDKKFTMEILCNLFFFLYRVNQYQGAKTSYLRQPLGNAKSFTMKTMAVRI